MLVLGGRGLEPGILVLGDRGVEPGKINEILFDIVR